MNEKIQKIMRPTWFLLVIMLISFFGVSTVLGKVDNRYELSWLVIGGDGDTTPSSGDSFEIADMVTQPIVSGESSNGSYSVISRFWGGHKPSLLAIYALAFDGEPNSPENLSHLLSPTINDLIEKSQNAPHKTAIVLGDQHEAADTHIYIIQNGEVEVEYRLPEMNPESPDHEIVLNPEIDEYEMTDGGSLGLFLRWALDEYATAATKTTFTYVSHGTFLAPDVDLETVLATPTPTTLGQEGRSAVGGSFFPLPTEVYAKAGLSDNNPKESVITPHALQVALEIGTDGGNNPLDVLDIVHCFSGSIEEFYELSNPGGTPYAMTMIGSANYSYFAPSMLGRALEEINPVDDAAGIATSIMTAYNKVLEEADSSDDDSDVEHPRTIVVVKSSQLPPIKQQMDVLSSFLMTYLDSQPTATKNKLVSAYQNAAHYDTTTCPPRDWQLSAPDALVDIGAFMGQIVNQNISPEVTAQAETVVDAIKGGAIITHTARSGVPWFSESSEPWALNEEDISGLALYADFEGEMPNDNKRLLSWHSTFYTDSEQIELDNGIVIPNQNPYLFIQDGNGEETWADVFYKLWQIKRQEWADNEMTMTIETSLCLPDFPPPQQEGELSVESITFPYPDTVYLNHPPQLVAVIKTESKVMNPLVRFDVHDDNNQLVFSDTVGMGHLVTGTYSVEAVKVWTPTTASLFTLTVTIDPDNRFLEEYEHNNVSEPATYSPRTGTPFELNVSTQNNRQWFDGRTINLNIESNKALTSLTRKVSWYQKSDIDPRIHIPGLKDAEPLGVPSSSNTSFDLAPSSIDYPSPTNHPGPITLHIWGNADGEYSQDVAVLTFNYAPPNQSLNADEEHYFLFNATESEQLELSLNVTAGQANMYIWEPNNQWTAQKVNVNNDGQNIGVITFGEEANNPTRTGRYTVMVEGVENETSYTISSLNDGVSSRSIASSVNLTSTDPIIVQLPRPTFIEPIPEIPEEPPAAVQLATFEAESTSDHIAVSWQTVVELDNLGFNLYRSSDETTVGERLNSSLIASQAPGSGQGGSYEWLDDEVVPETTYYYWLEDVETTGVTTLHGPVSATANIPTAITFDSLHATRPSADFLIISGLLLALMGIVGAAVRWRNLQSR